jgi:hypothetical protein
MARWKTEKLSGREEGRTGGKERYKAGGCEH